MINTKMKIEEKINDESGCLGYWQETENSPADGFPSNQ